MDRVRKMLGGRDSGATIVEFALIFPIIMVLTFAIIEFGFILRDQVATTNLVRDASRTASTNPRVGNLDGHWGSAVPASETPKNPVGVDGLIPPPDPSFAFKASQAVETSGSSLPKDSITQFWVYLANAAGYPATQDDWKADPNRSMTCLPKYCVRYYWKDKTDGFRYDGLSQWNPATINACPRSYDTGAQAVGIYMRVEHKGFFGSMFGSTFDLTDRNVVKFEPKPTDSCKAP